MGKIQFGTEEIRSMPYRFKNIPFLGHWGPKTESLTYLYGSEFQAVGRHHLPPAQEHDLRGSAADFQYHGIGPPEHGQIVFQGKAYGKVHEAALFNALHDGDLETRFQSCAVYENVAVAGRPEGAGCYDMNIFINNAPAPEKFL